MNHDFPQTDLDKNMAYRIIKFNADDREAELEFFSSVGNFLCYAWGYETADAIIPAVFTLLFAENIVREDEPICSISKTEISHFSHHLQGKYLGNNKMQIEDYIFHIDGHIPADIAVGEYISLDCTRINL